MVAKQKPGPHPENPKDTMIRVRVDKVTLEKLQDSAKQLKTTRSDIIRKGIEMVHDSLEN